MFESTTFLLDVDRVLTCTHGENLWHPMLKTKINVVTTWLMYDSFGLPFSPPATSPSPCERSLDCSLFGSLKNVIFRDENIVPRLWQQMWMEMPPPEAVEDDKCLGKEEEQSIGNMLMTSIHQISGFLESGINLRFGSPPLPKVGLVAKLIAYGPGFFPIPKEDDAKEIVVRM